MIIVPGFGPQPSPWMVVGERPGRVEASMGRPFCGPSGDEHRRYLYTFGLDPRDFRLDNCCRSYHPENDTPTAADIEPWIDTIEAEVRATAPRVIFAVGGTATRWFLGPCDLDAVTGLPHLAGAFDSSIVHRACGAVVVPIYHPARGLHDDGFRPMVSSRYEMAAEVLKRVARGLRVNRPRDSYAGHEVYRDIGGHDLASILAFETPHILGLDTEGIPGWSIQVSTAPGTGYLVRRSRPDFAEAVAGLQHLADRGTIFCMHQASGPDFSFHDMVICREMGLELRYAKIWDSMYAAYLLRTEPQGLKPLSYRRLGKQMSAFESLVAGLGRDRQEAYLLEVMARKWPNPEPYLVREGDGTRKLYAPEAPHKAAKRILSDMWAGKLNKEGEPADPFKRWKSLDKSVRKMAAAEMGPMLYAPLDDLPVEDMAQYAIGDCDSPLRLYADLGAELERRNLTPLMAKGMSVLGFFEEMQARGMPGSHSRFLALLDHLGGELDQLQYKISVEHCGGRPFNPNSPIDVPALMAERGISSARRTKSGKPSTSKKHIGHLKFTDKAMYDIFAFRERSKLKGSFVEPVVEALEEKAAAAPDVDIFPVRTNLKLTRVITRRPASSKSKSGGEEVNLLNIPKRTKHGLMVRECYIAPEGHVFVQADWSQCQVRLFADACRDPLMIAAYMEDRDLYRETAARIWGIGLDQVTKEQRQSTKAAVLGTIFGLQALGLRDQLWADGLEHWTEKMCDDLLNSLYRVYRGIQGYFARVERELRGSRECPNPHGEIRDMWGLVRYLPGIHSHDRKVWSAAIREAVNFRMQAAESGMMYNVIESLVPVIREHQEAGIEVLPRLEVYDSLMFTVPEWYAGGWGEILLDAMLTKTGVGLAVPIKADVAVSKCWGNLG